MVVAALGRASKLPSGTPLTLSSSLARTRQAETPASIAARAHQENRDA
jgi:hypothetical protein